MTSVVAVKKEVEKIRERVLPKPKEEIWVVCAFPWDRDEPHGRYGWQALEIYTQQYRAVSEEEELKMLRESFEGIPDEVRKQTDYWDTWEHFLEHRRCKCGKHDSVRAI